MGTLVAIAALGAAMPAPAGAAVVSAAHGPRFGVQPLQAAMAAPHASLLGAPKLDNGPLDTGHADSNVSYHGGPVVHGFTSYAFFWDPANAFSTTTKNLLTSYLANTAQDSGTSDSIFSVASQYRDSGGDAVYAQTFGGAITDTDPYPTSGGCKQTTATATTCLYNSQELAALHGYIANHHLPTGLGAVYVIFTPDTVVNCMAGGNECSNNDYCSFHSFAGSGASTLLYIEIPFTLLDDASDAKSCQDDGSSIVQSPNGDPGFGDVALKALSHEEIETITDPLLNAWYAGDGDEVADMCNDISSNPNSFLPTEGGTVAAGTLYNQTINGAHYYLQGVWSNATSACAMSLTPTLTPTFSLPSPVSAGGPVSFTGTPGNGPAAGSGEYVWSFGPSDTAAGESVIHTFPAAGSYRVELTVTDASGATGVTSQSIMVAAGGKTAGAVGTSKVLGHHKVSTTCTAVRSASGTKTRVCTTTTVTTPKVLECKHKRGATLSTASGQCRKVDVAVAHERVCKLTRGNRAPKWSRRCADVRTSRRARAGS